ncbi:MAG: S49 family peptidase [Methyloversatilis sp.]|jgi:protease-4|uniref:Peptidase S49 n=1 Tax=Methyloversatilis universalis (strain ATCC BAA-1314 / DSM 25237 / JCM 13912 / CCUG 52030 / FAM5) TaxID=1000565 RepID=F5R8P7_METUF|nr:S49 family peptidase [Methyloversatilis universalis]EGK72787.1 Putative peptidase S49 [Methyloversatilis universalis FAM5]MCP4634882.1 S49 family peptidase [Methyloversatilis sp.]
MSESERQSEQRVDPTWERKLIERLALESVVEQRRRRRWSIFFRLVGFAYLGVLAFALIDWSALFNQAEHRKHTALVELSGVIAPNGEASADRIISSLQSAFDDKNTQGVILKINSPGGSPVQSGIINDEIYRLRALYPDTPLYAVVEDICASGGYYVAVAADRIYVDKASIVGSIGVLMDGFGFTGLMDKVGVERRLLTAGENKGFLDPFSPQDPRQKAHAQQLLGDVHEQFIAVVRKGRGDRLKESPDMFSGLMWSGSRSIELGLADDLGSVEFVARDVVKAADIVDFTQRQNIAERFAKKFGADLGESVAGALGRVGMR